jgi:PQQ-dependent dehydrogenase (methanol/ethanol family)
MSRTGRSPHRGLGAAALSAALLVAAPLAAQRADSGRQEFAARCAGCHGVDGAGGEHGPDIVDVPEQGGSGIATLTPALLRQVVTHGIPGAGMPAFTLTPAQLDAVAAYVMALRSPAADHPPAGDAQAGAAFFFGEGQCASCHTVGGRGGVLGPDLTNLGRVQKLSRIEQVLRDPSAQITPAFRVVSVRLRGGETVRGLAKNESNYDLQLEDLSGHLRLLGKDSVVEETHEASSLMPPLRATDTQRRDLLAYLSRLSGAAPGAAAAGATSAAGPSDLPFTAIETPRVGDWPTYHGALTGNRFSPLRTIDTSNVAGLAPRWIFPIADAVRLEVTPVVADGVMYVTMANEAFALDARTGRAIWHYARPLTKGVIGDAGGAINRGVAILDDRVFMVTDHAHLIALSRIDGRLLWDVEMADYRQHYGATSAPLVVHDLVLSGTSGGDEGDRGFIDAYRASTGEHVWRFWTMPAPGDPLASTWKGRAIQHGCVAAWLTGTYDSSTDLLFWPTGNPCPDYNGDERLGDNLYSSSVLALEPETGKLRWYYQFTPHDLHDWDGSQTPMLVDAEFQGRPRQLLVQASRNGFFYVLDRVTGEVLEAQPFVHKLTWADRIGTDGRPHLLPGAEPTVQGTKVCPSVEGATNWMSTAYNPSTGLYYVMALEACSVYSKSTTWWQRGQSFYGGGSSRVPGELRQKYLRAIDIQTGKVAWEVPQIGDGDSWAGVLSTAGGLVIYGDDGGALAAVNARTGAPLWHFHTSESLRASPMTYAVDGTQYVAIAAGSNIIAFALPAGTK